MLWIVLAAGWLLLAPLIAWVLGTGVVLADHAERPLWLDEAGEDGTGCTPADVRAELEPELVAAG